MFLSGNKNEMKILIIIIIIITKKGNKPYQCNICTEYLQQQMN